MRLIGLNYQPAEKPSNRTDGRLEVVEIFHTLQGEGPDAGRPAVFVRLAGCNLQCPDCDTDYTSTRTAMAPEEILDAVRTKVSKLNPRAWLPMVVVTGGEPFRQPLGPALLTLATNGFRIQVETNGTLYRDDLPWFSVYGLSVVCSPKTPDVNDRLRPMVTALKYVLEGTAVDADGLPARTISGMRPCRPWAGFRGDVFVQPADEGDPDANAFNLKAAVESCLKFGYRLSLQTHKICNLP